MKYIERRQSETTGDAIWMKFECGAGSRWTSTTEDSTGDICGFSGCSCGTTVKFMGDTESRSEGWFGLRVGKTGDPFNDCPGPKLGRAIPELRHDFIARKVEESEAKRIDRENVAAFEVQMQQASGKLFL